MTDLEKKILEESVDLEKVSGGGIFDDDYDEATIMAKVQEQDEQYAREHPEGDANFSMRAPVRKRTCASPRAIAMARRARKRRGAARTLKK